MADEPKHVQPSKVSPDKAPKRAQLSNDKQIQSLKAEGVPYEHAIKGGKGLRIKVAATGKRAWYYRYRNRASGALDRIKIGDAPHCACQHLAGQRPLAGRFRQLANAD